MRRLMIVLALVVAASGVARAQIGVHDVAVTARNRITAALKEYLLTVQQEQHRKLRRMARRLSVHTNLIKYLLADPPRWRTHGWDDFLFSQAYIEALIFGDADGAGYVSVTQPVTPATDLLKRLGRPARQTIEARLATVNLTDASVIAATNDTGRLRYSGRKRELPAINFLEADVIDPSNEQSATAVLDKISGAVLIGAQQRQARLQLLAAIVEQLLIDSKRARDTEAAMIDTQLVTWRDGRSVNEAMIAGTGDALRVWRQP